MKKALFLTSICLISFCIPYSYASDSKEGNGEYNQYQKDYEIRAKITSKLYLSAQKEFAKALRTRAQLHSVGLPTLAETAVDGNISEFLFKICIELAGDDPEIKRYLDSNGGIVKAAALLSEAVRFTIIMHYEGYRKGLDFFFGQNLKLGSMQVKHIHKIVKEGAIKNLDELKRETEQKNVSE